MDCGLATYIARGRKAETRICEEPSPIGAIGTFDIVFQGYKLSPEDNDLFELQRLEVESEIGKFAARYDGEWREPAEAYVKHLTEGDPDVWHGAVTGWNTDGGYTPIRWVMRQPECDRATARWLFFCLDVPGFIEQYARPDLPIIHREAVDIAKELWDRLQAGFYRRSELEFTPKPYMSPFTIDKVLAMSPEQLEAIPGRKVTPWDMERDWQGKYAWEYPNASETPHQG